MIDKENTTNLINELMSSGQLRSYMQKYDFDNSSYLSFPDFVDQMMQQKNIKKALLIRKLNMTRSYAYEVFSGFKKPSRDKTLVISYGLELDYKGTQQLLLCARHNPLHPKDKRDSIIIFAKCNGHSLMETNMLLDEFDQEILE